MRAYRVYVWVRAKFELLRCAGQNPIFSPLLEELRQYIVVMGSGPRFQWQGFRVNKQKLFFRQEMFVFEALGSSNSSWREFRSPVQRRLHSCIVPTPAF